MSAQPQEQPRRQRAAPAPGKGPASAPVSPFRQPGALNTTPQSVELPPGYRATLDPPVKSDGFLGDSFTLDSQEFLVWLSDYFADDMVTMRLTIRLMGMASPGGEVEVTQQKLAELLTKGAKTRRRRRSARRPGEAAEQPSGEDDGRRVLQSQVSRSLKLLSELGVIVKLKPGLYQIHPRLSPRRVRSNQGEAGHPYPREHEGGSALAAGPPRGGRRAPEGLPIPAEAAGPGEQAAEGR